MDKKIVIKSFYKTIQNFKQILPIIISILILLSALKILVPTTLYEKIFTSNPVIDSFIGAILGSISAGTPITSYVIGGELLKQGVSIIAITAFLLGWVTVGIIQLPIEASALGKRFAITRNVTSFVSAVIIGILTYFTLTIFT